MVLLAEEFNFRSFTLAEQVILSTLYEKPRAMAGWNLYEIFVFNTIHAYLKDYTEQKFQTEKKELGRLENIVKKYRSVEMPIPSYVGVLGLLEYFEKERLISHRQKQHGGKQYTLYFLTPFGESQLRKVFGKKNHNGKQV